MPVQANPGLGPRKDPLFEPLLLSFLFHCKSAMWCARCTLGILLQDLSMKRFREHWFVGLTALLSRELYTLFIFRVAAGNTWFGGACHAWAARVLFIQRWDRSSQSCRRWSVFKKLCQSSHVTSSPFQQEIVFSTRAVDLALLVFGTVCIAPCIPRWPSWNVQGSASCSFKMQSLPLGRLPSSMTQNHGSSIFRKALKILEAAAQRTLGYSILHAAAINVL